MLDTIIPHSSSPSPFAGNGQSYTLPPYDVNLTPQLAMRDGSQSIAHGHGRWVDNGMAGSYIDQATLDVTFIISQSFLLTRYGTGSANWAGLMRAIAEFTMWVVQGGMATWIDHLPAGTQIPTATSLQTVTTRSFTGRVTNTPKAQYLGSNALVALLPITIQNPSGLWTWQPGNILTPMNF